MASKRSDFGDGASPGKIFIGGLSKETQITTFVEYFGKYGSITDSVIMKDRLTGRPRGFGFITYADPSVVDTIIKETHVIDGKQVELKRTIPKGSTGHKDFKTKKIFVGGIPAVVTEEEFKEFFSKYGQVAEHEIIRDHVTKRPRGFGFIVFESEQSVDDILVNGNMIDMNGTQVEIKKAEPKKSSQSGISSYSREPKGRGYAGGGGGGGGYDGFDDSYGGGYGSGGGGGGYGPPPYRSYGGPPSRFGDYGPYGPGGSDFGGRYGGGEYGGDYGGYRGGEPPLSGYSSRFSSYGGGGGGGYAGGYSGGYGAGGLGGYGRGGGGGAGAGGESGGYGGYGGPGGGGGGYEPGVGSGYGAGGPYGSRAGYSGGSRYHPYGR